MLDLPQYNPGDYRIKQSSVTSASPNFLIVGNDPSRVYLAIANIGLVSGAGAYYSFGSSSLNPLGMPYSGTAPFELSWSTSFALCTQEVYGNGFTAGGIFGVVEVVYLPFTNKGRYDATRKPESLAAKIKIFAQSWTGKHTTC